MAKKLPGPAVHRRAVVLFTAALLLGLGLPRASAESRQDEPTSLITSPGYTRTTASPAPGLTLFTYQNPDDDRVVHVLRADPDAAPLTVESTAGTSGARAEKTTDMLKSTTGYAPGGRTPGSTAGSGTARATPWRSWAYPSKKVSCRARPARRRAGARPR